MKILLNSLYGALLNSSCKFYDQRIGQSVTLTGRSIVRHMNAKVNEVITGIYDYVGDAIIYSDTDSAYFSASCMENKDQAIEEILKSRDDLILYYNEVGNITNESFTEFMVKSFNTSDDRGSIIKAAREIVGSSGLFIKKKKYALLYYDKDGKRADTGNKPGKIKAMGLDLKRSDTPKVMQDFLEKLLMQVLTFEDKKAIMKEIGIFRDKFRLSKGWEKGTPKKVNALSDYEKRVSLKRNAKFGEVVSKVNLPGHVSAAINWNMLKKVNGDNYSMEIQDGQKIIVCKLKANTYNIKSIAYPIDENHLPKWFKALPFDDETMEEVIIDNKITNMIGVMEWDLRDSKNDTTYDDFFE